MLNNEFLNSSLNIHNYLIPLWRLLRRGSPLPIPNREVKPACADGTWPKARESMSMPILKKQKPHSNVGLFAFI